MKKKQTLQVYSLENGIRLILNPIEDMEVAGIGIHAGAGSVTETAALMGYSHLLEHMVFKGTSRRDYISINKDIEKYGGYLNAFTDKHFTCYYAKILGDYSLQALDVLTDMVTDPVFPEEELEKEKRVVLEEISMYEDSPDESIADLFFEHFYPNSFLGWPVLGTREIISSVTQKKIREYWGQYYRTGNLIISLSGKFDSEKVLDFVSSLKATGAAEKQPQPLPQAFYGAGYKEKEVEQAHLALGLETFSLTDERKYSLGILNNIIGANTCSRLYLNIREKLGLCYAVSSMASLDEKTGVLGVFTSTQPENLEKMTDAVIQELKSFETVPPSKEELEIAKAQARSQILFQRGNVSFHMQKNAADLFWFKRIIPEEEILSRIESVSLEDIQKVHHDLFSGRKELSAFAILPHGTGKKWKKNITIG